MQALALVIGRLEAGRAAAERLGHRAPPHGGPEVGARALAGVATQHVDEREAEAALEEGPERDAARGVEALEREPALEAQLLHEVVGAPCERGPGPKAPLDDDARDALDLLESPLGGGRAARRRGGPSQDRTQRRRGRPLPGVLGGGCAHALMLRPLHARADGEPPRVGGRIVTEARRRAAHGA